MNVYTGGTFDLFHAGHVNFLKQCKKLAGTGNVTVALNKDDFIEKYKGKPPIINEDDRLAVIKSCIYVDRVIWNMGGEDAKYTLRYTYRSITESRFDPNSYDGFPDIIAIGDDWAKKDYYAQMQFTQQWLDERNILLAYIPYTQGISSTEIKERLK